MKRSPQLTGITSASSSSPSSSSSSPWNPLITQSLLLLTWLACLTTALPAQERCVEHQPHTAAPFTVTDAYRLRHLYAGEINAARRAAFTLNRVKSFSASVVEPISEAISLSLISPPSATSTPPSSSSHPVPYTSTYSTRAVHIRLDDSLYRTETLTWDRTPHSAAHRETDADPLPVRCSTGCGAGGNGTGCWRSEGVVLPAITRICRPHRAHFLFKFRLPLFSCDSQQTSTLRFLFIEHTRTHAHTLMITLMFSCNTYDVCNAMLIRLCIHYTYAYIYTNIIIDIFIYIYYRYIYIYTHFYYYYYKL